MLTVSILNTTPAQKPCRVLGIIAAFLYAMFFALGFAFFGLVVGAMITGVIQ